MTLLDRLLGHDAWTTRQMLLLCRDLSNAQLDATFDMSHGTVRKTFLHILRNMEAWTDVMSGRPIRPKQDDEPDQRSVPGMIKRPRRGGPRLRAGGEGGRGPERLGRDLDRPDRPRRAREDLRRDDRPPADALDAPPRQLIFMLRKLGVPEIPEGDLLLWELQLGKAR
jgi:hypothetical protein